MSKVTIAKGVAWLVAAIAAVTSYGHQVHLLSLADLDPLFGLIPGEWITPVTVDSLAIIALMIRRSPEVTDRTRKLALIPLVIAGGMSIAANVAMARNIVQVIVGIWTVGAYILAEIFVGMMERKTAAPAAEPKTARKVSEAEKNARKRAGWAAMSPSEKRTWTKNYRSRSARRTELAAPTSPGHGPVSAPSAAMLEEAVR
jgi:hypothetical protein